MVKTITVKEVVVNTPPWNHDISADEQSSSKVLPAYTVATSLYLNIIVLSNPKIITFRSKSFGSLHSWLSYSSDVWTVLY